MKFSIPTVTALKEAIGARVRPYDPDLLAQAEQEVENEQVDKALWMQALIKAKGNQDRRKLVYITLRSRSLEQEQQQERERIEQEQQQERERVIQRVANKKMLIESEKVKEQNLKDISEGWERIEREKNIANRLNIND